ncbi:hypothetical protein ACFE04_000568 [Oxalis oulophora]
MSSKRVLCKFFAHGACLKADNCEFSHDWKAPPNNICTYYQKGICVYGNRCRYEHVKQSSLVPTTEVVVVGGGGGASSSSTIPHESHSALPSKASSSWATTVPQPRENFEPQSAFVTPIVPPTIVPAWTPPIENNGFVDNDEIYDLRNVQPADRPLCSFAAAGDCPRGENCPHVHGDLCSTCGKNCLHPFRPEERDEHVITCQKKQKHLEALKHSQEIECSVCLDRVLLKPTAAERKFGLLSECDHPFCISCIRNWRSSSPTAGMDLNTSLRACPICRKLSYFVIPSVIWYASSEEKNEIVENYHAKLRSIDCKHFNFGNGNCPFGTSCFYRHMYRDGRLEEVDLRHLGSEDGVTVIAKDIRISLPRGPPEKGDHAHGWFWNVSFVGNTSS